MLARTLPRTACNTRRREASAVSSRMSEIVRRLVWRFASVGTGPSEVRRRAWRDTAWDGERPRVQTWGALPPSSDFSRARSDQALIPRFRGVSLFASP